MGARCSSSPTTISTTARGGAKPGGGPILINMIHEVHNLRMLCGEIVGVQAFASRATRGFPVEDTVAINLRFANGALGSFMLSDTGCLRRNWEHTSQENKAYPTYADEDCYIVMGTGGSLSIPTMRSRPMTASKIVDWWKPFRTSVADVTAPIRWRASSSTSAP
jgi:predicted dehydrogenase